jgi:hypothetical protein
MTEACSQNIVMGVVDVMAIVAIAWMALRYS